MTARGRERAFARSMNDRAEMVGIVAIVASLIFVGGELRQNAIA